MESKEYYKIHFSKTWKDVKEHIKKHKNSEIYSVIAAIIIGLIIGVRFDQLLISTVTPIAAVVLSFLYLLFRKWMNTSKDFYEENQYIREVRGQISP